MPTRPYDRAEKRVLNPHGRRHYRRRYSTRDLRIGLVVLVGLAGIAAWVGYEGAHPDPELFATSDDLLDPGTPAVERGPLPAGLAPPGWVEGRPARFDVDTLYEKINGRAGYFTSRGFEELRFLPLVREGGGASVDLELYDMGTTANALGAYAGEKSEEVESERRAGGLAHLERNALYLTAGPYYARVIGSDESAEVVGVLEGIRDRLVEELAVEGGGELPWAHRLFMALDIEPGQVSFQKQGAFSFGFARNVFVALADADTELFVSAVGDASAAREARAAYLEGFASYGELEEGDWVRDRYLGSYATARVDGALVYGLRGAPDRATAEARLEALTAALAGLDPAEIAAASSAAADAAAPEAPAGDYAGG